MNPAFEPTDVLVASAPAAGARRRRTSVPRMLQAAAAVLAAAALLGVALWVLLAPDTQAPAGLALTGALMSLGLLRGARLAGLREAAARGLVDEATGLYNARGLAEHGGALLRAARAARRPVSLVLLDFEDMVEVRAIYGRETSRRLLARVVRRLESVAGPRGFAARMDGARFALVLPGAGRERALAQVHRALGHPCRVEFDAGDSEIVLVPDVLAETAAADVETVEELYAEVLHNLLEQRAGELRRQHHLQRERERHSRPMGLPSVMEGSTRPQPVAPADPTQPAPLHGLL